MHRSIIASVMFAATLVAFSMGAGSAAESTNPVLVGAGDIATCGGAGDEATARLLANIPGTVFTAGDNAYPDGSSHDFLLCYDPSWGRFVARTRPAVGNHEYETPSASGYFDYFGDAAGPSTRGYYSYDREGWHIVVLNSMCEKVGGCGTRSPMLDWLRKDLASSGRACTLAYFHHPLFSSGAHGNQSKMLPAWKVLYAANVDVVVNGHDHDYERFAPQRPDGTKDTERGIREFVVGTGGAEHRPFAEIEPHSQVRDAKTSGVLKLTLGPDRYDWKFIPVTGQDFTDSGTRVCH
jgi:hypothetical protein